MNIANDVIHSFQVLSELALKKPLERSLKKTILFCRNYCNFTGGQLKVRDYFEHVLKSDEFEPWIYMTKNSDPSIENLWVDQRDRILKCFNYKKADIVFLAGPDWKFLPQRYKENYGQIKINYIQDFWATDQLHFLHQFLKYPAIRICVSDELKNAILETEKVNGPVIAIQNGINLADFQFRIPDRSRSQLTIFGNKNPKTAEQLAQEINDIVPDVRVITKKLSRSKIIENYASTKIAVLLPYEIEGFFLPAVEAMASRCAVIVPDCIGNRSFCINKKNALVTENTLESMKNAVLNMVKMPSHVLNEMRDQALLTAENYSIIAERKKFLSLLTNADQIWTSHFENR